MVLVHVVAHIDVGVSIIQFGVVVIWNGRERIKGVGVHLARSRERIKFSLLRSRVAVLLPGVHNVSHAEVGERPDSGAGPVAHTAHKGQGVHAWHIY